MSTLKATNIQNASSATTNIALDTSGNVTVGNNVTVGGGITASSGTVVMSSPYTMRNKIINGAMVIDQRNAGASVTPTADVYTLDRWQAVRSQSSKFSVQQNAASVTPPSGFTNYLGITSLSAYSVLTADYFIIQQNIEGFNTADLAWGTASAQAITLSFWVRSSLTGTFGGALNNNTNNRSYPFSYSVSAANTWEQKSITISGDTSGTWLTNNSTGIQVRFSLGMGATYSGTAGAWSGSSLYSATGATSVVGTNGATFYITGVQLERGTVATPFEYRNFQQELAMCMRYFWKWSASENGGVGYGFVSMGYAYSATNTNHLINLPVKMRTSPVFSYTGSWRVAGATAPAVSALASGVMNVQTPTITTTTSVTSGNAYMLGDNNDTTATLSFNAEL